MTLLAVVVGTSRRVSGTPTRLEKTRELAACLRAVAPDEIPVAIAYLSGETCQGKIGVAYASLQESRVQAAPEASLQLVDVDRAFAEIAQTKGKGSNEKRTALL